MSVTLSVIMPTQGRDTLVRAIESVTSQMCHGDELLVIRRDGVPYGNATRDEAIPRCIGSHLWWVDDDDIAAPGALATIRARVGEQPEAMHIFRMEYAANGDYLWKEHQFEQGRIGGPMCVVPNVPGKLGLWWHEAVHCGDFHFLSGTRAAQECELVWHEDVIYSIRPPA